MSSAPPPPPPVEPEKLPQNEAGLPSPPESPPTSYNQQESAPANTDTHLNPLYFPTADCEIAESDGNNVARRRSTVHPAGRPRPEFILPDLPPSAKQGRPTLVRELSYSTPTTPGAQTPYSQTPYTQTPISTRPPSPVPLLPHEKDEERRTEFPPAESYPDVFSFKSGRGFFILVTVCGAQLMDNIFMTSVNISLPTIQKELDVAIADLQWLISAYTLTFGGFLLLAGVLSERYGKKNMFVAGMVWMTVWSLANGFAQSFVSLAIFRALQGIGAAMTVPSAVGIVSTNIEPKERNKALSIFGASGAVGFSVGLIFGGLLTGTLGWRYVFRISAAITAAIALGGVLVLPQDRPLRSKDRPAAHHGPRPRLDFLGAAMSTSALILLSFVLSSGGVYGWHKAFIIALLVGSVAMLAVFVWLERTVANPIMPLTLWRIPNFAGVWLCGFVMYAGYQTVIYYITLVAQDVNRLSAKDTAVRFLPMGATGFVVSFIMGRVLSTNTNIKWLLLLGLVVCSLAPLPAALMTEANTAFWSQVFPSSVLAVAGISVGYNVVTVVMLSSVPANGKSLAGGMLNCAFQIGSGVGLALSAAVVQAVDTSRGHGLVQQYRTGLWCCMGLSALGLLAVLFGVNGQRGVAH